MSIINGFVPLPNWFIAGAINSNLTNREYKLYFTIGVEIFRFPETREVLSKELSCRFLQSLTGFHFSHIAKILKKFSKMGLITVKKSFVKGQGSIITLVAPIATIEGKNELTAVASVATENNKKVAMTATKGVAPIATTPINLSIRKDLQENDPDSLLNIEQAIGENPQEPSLNSLPDTKSFLTSFKENNLNNLAVNLLPPAGLASSNTGKNEFPSLGSVLTSGVMKSSDICKKYSRSKDVDKNDSLVKDTYNVLTLSDKAIIEGKAILQEKGFTAPQIQAITQRITDSIRKHTPKKPDNYFLTAIKNEKIKPAVTGSTAPASRQIPPGTGAMVQVQKNSFTETVNKWEEEKKKDSPEETIKKLMKLSPDELYRVILDVDSSPAGKFVSLPEIKASLYIAEFKKRFPEVKV